jgi:hypothetical protein
VNKLIENLEFEKEKYNIENVFIVLNGDIVSGRMIYRNQYIESHLQKNESIIMFGSYLIHKTIDKITKKLDKPPQVFIIAGNHEIGRRPQPQNFSVAISRRLNTYGHYTKYKGMRNILNIAKDLGVPEYNLCSFHGWGGSDYTSASYSMIRDMTAFQTQKAMYENIIIHRFLVSHTHWLEVGRSALGVEFDVLGGFQLWKQKNAIRPSGLIYYVYTEDGIKANCIKGIRKQIEEIKSKRLNTNNMIFVAQTMQDAFDFECDKGLIRKDESEN